MRAFRIRDFTIFWCGALISNTGTWVLNLTVPFVLFSLTGSALWVGMAIAAQFLPMFLLSPLGGSIADHYPRRTVLLVTQAVMGLGAFALWLVWVLDMRNPALLLALVASISAVNGISMPSWQGFVHDLVPRDYLQSAVTLNGLQFNGARAFGPLVGGILLATDGPSLAFAVNAASFGCIFAALAIIRVGRGATRNPPSVGFVQQMRSTISYIGSQPGIVMAFVIAFVVAFFGNPVFSMTVVFAGSVFHVQALQLGIMNAALGVGALAVAPILGSGRYSSRLSSVAVVGLIGYGLTLICFGLSPQYSFGVVALVVIGACFLAVLASINTASQMIVANSFRGRVLAVRMMIFAAAATAGGLCQGWISDWVGPRQTLVLAGVGMLVATVVLATGRFRYWVVRLNDPHDVTTDVAGASR